MLGRDRLGRGILLTPEGDYRHAFVARGARPGDVVCGSSKPSVRTTLTLSAALAGAASVLICLAVSLSINHPVKVAEREYPPNPPRGVIYATLYLNSKAGDPVALDLDRQGHVVTVRAKGEKLARQQAVGHQVADVLENRDRLLAGVKVEPGEPLGLQIRASEKQSAGNSRSSDQFRSMDTGTGNSQGDIRPMATGDSKVLTGFKKDSTRIPTNSGRGDFSPPVDR